MRAVVALLLAAPALSFAQPVPGTPWPAGPLQRDEVHLGVLLVHVDRGTAARALEAIARLAPRHMPGFTPVQLGEDERPPSGKLSWAKGEDAWSDEELRYFARRVDPGVRARLTVKHPVTIVAVRGPRAGSRTLRGFTTLVGALATELGSVVYDTDTRDLWSASSWAKERVEEGFRGELPVVDHQIAIHSYRTDDGIRSVTLGMSKLALPDVVVEDGQTQSTSTEWLVHAVCQWMAERGSLAVAGRIPLELRKLQATPLRDRLLKKPGRGAIGAAEVSVAVGRRDSGDAENPLMEITFEGAPGQRGERQMALLTRLFGAADQVSSAPAGDAELSEASRRARAALPTFKRAFANRETGERFMVKLPFRGGGETEYMWLEVRAWKGAVVEGVLQDEPFRIKGLRRGARLKVDEGEIYDWLWNRADGSTEGGETSRILEQREGR